MFGAVCGVVGGIFGFLTILILTFYLLVDADDAARDAAAPVPARRRPRVAAASRDITVKVSAWLGGQLLLGAVIGVTSAIGLWLIGRPVLLRARADLGDRRDDPRRRAAPGRHSRPSRSPAPSRSQKVLLVIIFFVVQQQFENHVLVPKVMSRQVGVSAVTVIVALLIGGNLLGIVGAILAVPTAAILQVVFTEVTRENTGWIDGDDFPRGHCDVDLHGEVTSAYRLNLRPFQDRFARKLRSDRPTCGRAMVQVGTPGQPAQSVRGPRAGGVPARAGVGRRPDLRRRRHLRRRHRRQPADRLADGVDGAGAALTTAKVTAGMFGIALHITAVHKAVATLAGFYFAVARRSALWFVRSSSAHCSCNARVFPAV